MLGGITGSDKWVSGYIVGFSSSIDANTSAKFTAAGANNLNVLIADKASEKDVKKCIAIGLPAGDVRAALNLKNHPENLGKKVTVKGTISTVYKIPGVTQPTAFKF